MRTLNYTSLDISGFAGIRERVLVMDRRYFKNSMADEVFDGFGACVYLAHAYFTPNGSTGRHHHQAVDIISIFTKGEVLHQGTLGDGEHFASGQVLVQCSGPQGFSHNEINAVDDISGMVQLWCVPSTASACKQKHEVIPITDQGLQRIYGGQEGDSHTKIASDTQLDILILANEQSMALNGKRRLYVFEGEVNVQEGDSGQVLTRGTLCDGENLILQGNMDCKVLIQTQIL